MSACRRGRVGETSFCDLNRHNVLTERSRPRVDLLRIAVKRMLTLRKHAYTPIRSAPRALRLIDAAISAPLGEFLDHASEDHAVDWVKRVPVNESRESLGREKGGLDEKRASVVVLRFHFELQPRFPWHFHLRAQPHQVVWLHGFDPPEIERFSHSHRVGVASPAAEAYSAAQAVEGAADTPGPIHVEPAAPSTKAGESLKNRLRRCIDGDLPVLDDHALVRGQRDRGRVHLARGQRIAPGGFDFVGAEFFQRELHRGPIIQRLDLREKTSSEIVVHDDLIAQAGDQRPGNGSRESASRSEPNTRRAWASGLALARANAEAHGLRRRRSAFRRT